MPRKMSPEADAAILDATMRLLGEAGYARLTIEGVSAAAGVAKTTIYRRYGDKADLVAAALARVRVLDAPPATGDARADMVSLVRRFQALMQSPARTMLATLLAEEHHSPELLARFRERLIEPSRAQARAALEAARERGEIRADADLDLIMDMLAGSYFTRHLAGVPVATTTAEELVDTVWCGIAAEPRRRRRRR